MKKVLVSVLAVVAGTAFFSSCGNNVKTAKMESYMDTVSYAQGLVGGTEYGKYLDNPDINGNKQIFSQAFALGLANDSAKFAMTREEAYEILQKYNMKMREEAQKKMEEERKAAAAMMKIKSDEAIEKYKQEEGVKTTESGLMYKIIKAGNGAIPAETDIVEVNYEGKLVDGTVFDSSYERKQSIKFPVNGVIKGWTEALKMMPVGSTWELMIPSELAYGERGAGNAIPGNAALIFKVDLLGKEAGSAQK